MYSTSLLHKGTLKKLANLTYLRLSNYLKTQAVKRQEGADFLPLNSTTIMNLAKSKMRLFNGHLKLDNKSLKKVFLMQLNNIFMVKTYLIANLPAMAESASFKDLKNAILENVDDVKIQLLRLLVIYDIIGEKYKRSTITGIRGLIMEAYVVNKAAKLSGFESDLMMLYHLNTL